MEFGDFFVFEILMLCLIDMCCVLIEMLYDEECVWLNMYYVMVCECVGWYVSGDVKVWFDVCM